MPPSSMARSSSSLVPSCDTRVVALAELPQCQAGPGGRLDPGEVPFAPGPTGEYSCRYRVVRRSRPWGALWPRISSKKAAVFCRLSAWRRPMACKREQHQRRWPNRFLAAIVETITAVVACAFGQESAGCRHGILILVAFQTQSQKAEAGGFQLGGLTGGITPAAVGMSLLVQNVQER